MMLLLREALELELPTFVLTEGTDASDNRTLLVAADATPAAGEEVAFVTIIPRTYTGFPTTTLAQASVEPDGRPHQLQVIVEESAVAGVSVWSTVNYTKLMARLLDMNIEVDLWLCNNTELPAEGNLDTSLGAIRTDPRHPNNGN
jgi:hypothetical protein